MARPRSNKSPRKGSGTSFGKRTDAEKSFHKKSPKRSDDSSSDRPYRASGPGFRKSSGGFSKPSFGKSSSRPDRDDKPSGFSKPRYGDRDEKGSGFSKPRFGDRDDKKSSFSKPRFGDRDDKKGGFSKPRFGDPDDKKGGFSKPRFGDRDENKSGISKPRFGDREDRRDKPEGTRPYSKPFRSNDRDEKKPFRSDDTVKRPERTDESTPRPDGFTKRTFSRDKRGDDFKKPEGFHRKGDKDGSGDFKKPFKKSGDFEKRGDIEKDFEKKSFGKEERKSFVQSRVTTAADFTKPGRKPKTDSPSRTDSPIEEAKGDGVSRLNKFIANSGVGSRRDADKLITMGLISVNGVTITELGTKVKSGDVVRYEDRILKAEKPVYILLNKPKGFITTTDDPQERNTVMGLVAGACKERIYPVGRLDRNTTGLLLLTNDGDLADKLTHPSYKAKKVYKVELDKPFSKNDFDKVLEGVRLEEGKAMVDDLAIISDDKKTVGLEIHIGWNRVVRRIFETLGYEVVRLDRSVYAGLDKKDTPRGEWRFLKAEEIVMLKHFK